MLKTVISYLSEKTAGIRQFIKHYGDTIRFTTLGVLVIVLLVLIVVNQANSGRIDIDAIKVDEYKEVNKLVDKYYKSVADNDIKSLKEIVVPFNSADESTVAHKSELIDKYENIKCYTHKNGVGSDYYIVFAYYEIHFPDVSTLVPGLETLVIQKDSEDKLYINNDTNTLTDAQKNKLNDIVSRIEVIALFDDVETSFSLALHADEGVYDFVNALVDDMDKYDGTDKGSAKDSITPTTEGLKLGETDPPKKVEEINGNMVAVINLDLYQNPDTNSTIISNIPVGSVVYVKANKENDFSEVTFNNSTGFVENKYIYNSIDVNDKVKGTCAYYISCSTVIDPLGNLAEGTEYERTRYFGNGYSEIKVNDTLVFVKTSELSK